MLWNNWIILGWEYALFELQSPGALNIYIIHSVEILGVNVQCCSLSKRKTEISQDVLEHKEKKKCTDEAGSL